MTFYRGHDVAKITLSPFSYFFALFNILKVVFVYLKFTLGKENKTLRQFFFFESSLMFFFFNRIHWNQISFILESKWKNLIPKIIPCYKSISLQKDFIAF
jgi:hypothetical protein